MPVTLSDEEFSRLNDCLNSAGNAVGRVLLSFSLGHTDAYRLTSTGEVPIVEPLKLDLLLVNQAYFEKTVIDHAQKALGDLKVTAAELKSLSQCQNTTASPQ